MRKILSIFSLILAVSLSFSSLSWDQPAAEAQKMINNRDVVVNYSIFVKSNYTTTGNITFLWYFRQTEWSKVEVLSARPAVSGSAYIDCEGNSVNKDDFTAFQAFGWRFDAVVPDDILQIEFKIRAQVSAFSPSTLSSEMVGTLGDVKAKFSEEELEKYQCESYYWDYGSSEVKSVMQQIIAQPDESSNVYEIVRSTLMWFTAHTMYSYPYEFDYPAGRAKASEILKQSFLGRHYGLCRHYVDVFTAVMRGFGIPCLMEEGLVLVEREGEVDVVGRHAWAVVYFPKVGWRRVDVTVPDRSTLDMIGVGLSSYPLYYVPEYIEYANESPRSINGTVYPYTLIGGSIKAGKSGYGPVMAWEELAVYGLLSVTLLLAILVITTRARVRRIERQLSGAGKSSFQEATPRFCTICGAPRPLEALFCTKCGNRFR